MFANHRMVFIHCTTVIEDPFMIIVRQHYDYKKLRKDMDNLKTQFEQKINQKLEIERQQLNQKLDIERQQLNQKLEI